MRRGPRQNTPRESPHLNLAKLELNIRECHRSNHFMIFITLYIHHSRKLERRGPNLMILYEEDNSTRTLYRALAQLTDLIVTNCALNIRF